MRNKRIAEPGKKFGHWTVICDAGKEPSGHRIFMCRCACGREMPVHISNLYAGKTTSCGCMSMAPRGENKPPDVAGATWLPVGGNRWTLVDTEDVGLFNGKLLHFNGRVAYVVVKANGKQYNHKAHRIVLGLSAGDTCLVDHINRNPLDNRRSNLRLCSISQNNMNRQATSRSGFKGVSPNGSGWAAHIKRDRKVRHLGTYRTKEEAARAYDAAAKSLFGEFAFLNFPS